MEKQKIWRKARITVCIIVAIWLILWFLGPVLLPFALGLLVAKAAEPPMKSLIRQFKLPRWLAAGLCVTMLYILLVLLVMLVCQLLCREIQSLIQALPAAAQSAAAPIARLEQSLLRLASRFPDGIGLALEEGIREFFRTGAGLADTLYHRLFSFVSALLLKTPDLALFILTAVLSGFMIASELPQLRSLWKTRVPTSWQMRLHTLLDRIKRTLGAWFRTQLKLMAVTFLVLTAGFLLLRTSYPLLFGLLIALIDALPVFGSGTILIPWGLFQFLQGDTFLGTGLLCLYGATALTRAALEPRMLGKQIGLNPLLTLLALYSGYRFLGIGGMILFPLGAMLAKQFWSSPAEPS